MSSAHDKILDEMSLSSSEEEDDAFFNDLADDLLQENTVNPEKRPIVPTTRNHNSNISYPSQNAVAANTMPNLGNLMSQMMPMMSQMMGGQSNPNMLFNQNASIPNKNWKQIIQDSIKEKKDQDHWIQTIEMDVGRQSHLQKQQSWQLKRYSRAYKLKKGQSEEQTNGDKHLDSQNNLCAKLLAKLIFESMKDSADASPSKTEDEIRSEVVENGLLRIFQKELKKRFKSRVENDFDYNQEKEKFPLITAKCVASM